MEIDDPLEDDSLGYIMSIQVWRVGSLGSPKSRGILRDVIWPGRGASEGPPTIRPDGVEKVSIVDVDGDDPLSGVRPKAGREGIAGEDVRLSVMGESREWCMEPTTDSVWVGVEAGGDDVIRWGR
jgi:hypothetical protein